MSEQGAVLPEPGMVALTLAVKPPKVPVIEQPEPSMPIESTKYSAAATNGGPEALGSLIVAVRVTATVPLLETGENMTLVVCGTVVPADAPVVVMNVSIPP